MYNLSSAKKGAILPKFLLGFLFMAGLLLSQAVSRRVAHADPGDIDDPGDINDIADIAWQSFEVTPPGNEWTYSVNPSPYNISGDVWDVVPSLSSISPSDGSRFWGMQDLDNPNGGGDFDHTITFDPIDISAYGALQIQFDYNVIGFDTGDYLQYEVTVDGSGQGLVDLFVGDVGGVSTAGWETETIAAPGSANSVSLQLIANQDGGSDYAGWDNVRLIDVSTDLPPAVDSTDPADAASNVPVDADITVTFSEDVTVSGAWFAITCTSSGAHSAAVSGASPGATFTLDPDADFANSETCTVTIFAGQVADVDGTADNMTADYTWSFTTAPVSVCEDIVLNEINYDDPGGDDEEYVEIYSALAAGGASISLNDLLLRFFNVANDSEYLTVDLNGETMPADGYFVVGDGGVSNVDLSAGFSTGSNIQNGPDALGLYDGNAGVWCWRYVYENGAGYTHPTEGTFPVMPGDDEDLDTANQSLSRRQVTAPVGDFVQLAAYTPGGPNETPTAVSLHTLTAASTAPTLLLLAIAGLLALTLAWTRRPH